MTKVLVVENNAIFRKSLTDILHSRFREMQIVEAVNANEALVQVRTVRPDIIFLDIQLGNDSGLDVVSRIRSLCPRVPIIMLSQFDFPEYQEAARRLGATIFLSKNSSSTAELVELVGSLIQQLEFTPVVAPTG
jgi:DNA-binding NarL/FixJ family response regulator